MIQETLSGNKKRGRPETACMDNEDGSRNHPYEGIKLGHPLQKAQFLLQPTNLVRERLQTDRLAAHHNKHC